MPTILLLEQMLRLSLKTPEYNGFVSAKYYYPKITKNEIIGKLFSFEFQRFYLLLLWCKFQYL